MRTPEDMALCVHHMPARSCTKCTAGEVCAEHGMPQASCLQCASQKTAQRVTVTTTSSSHVSVSSEPIDLEKAKEMILEKLYTSENGMVPLPNGYTDEHTLAAFGLTQEMFNAAFGKLKAKRLVSPQPDGLHLSTAEKQKWLQAKEKGLAYPPKASGATALKTPASDNRAKLAIFARFNAVMDRLNIPVFLTGGAVANILYMSPRQLKDLDYRTTHFRKTFDQHSAEVLRINTAVAKEFAEFEFTPFTVDAQNKNAINGKVGGCDVTIARILNEEDLAGYHIAHHLISGEDLILDKATTFIFRTDDMKKATDLFDLLWSMRAAKMTPVTLMNLLQRKRGANYAKRVLSQLTAHGDKAGYYSEELTTQFAISLGHLLARGMVSVMRLLASHVGNGDIVKELKPELTALMWEFGVDFVEQPKGAKPLLIIQAGNMTGDMFGVSAALVLNPLAHVVLISDGSSRDKTEHLLTFYRESLPEKDAERIHVLHADRAKEPTTDISTLYTTYAGRQKKPLPYSVLEPSLTPFLRTPDHQFPISSATSTTAETWTQGTSHEQMKLHWKVDLQPTSLQGRTNKEKIEQFLKGRGVPYSKRYLVLWSRFSGKRGGPHAQHDTSFTGMRQMIHLALAEGYVVLIVGDEAKDPRKYDAIAALGRGQVLNLVEFWTKRDWKKFFPTGGRQGQFLLFEHLQQTSELKHLGSRSGNLEAFALMGHQVRYMEEAGNLQASRMEAWHAGKKGGIGYDRIVIEDRAPSRTGQWVTQHASLHKSESKPPWIEAPRNFRKDEFFPIPAYILSPDSKKRLRAQDRGFTIKDLEKIHEYLKHQDAQSASGLPTWILELYRRQQEYQAKGWVLQLVELDLAMQRRLHAFTAEPNSLLPEWFGKLLGQVHMHPPVPEVKVPVSDPSLSSKSGKGVRSNKNDRKGGSALSSSNPSAENTALSSGKSSGDATGASGASARGGLPSQPQLLTPLQMEAQALAMRVRPGQKVRFRYLTRGSTKEEVSVDCIGTVQSVADLGPQAPNLGARLTTAQNGTAIVSASAWPNLQALRTVQMPHVVVRATELLNGDNGTPLQPGPHVPNVLNHYFTLLERSFIQK